MLFSYSPAKTRPVFDDSNLLSHAGLAPVMAAGADSYRRHESSAAGAMETLFTGVRPPPGLWSFSLYEIQDCQRPDGITCGPASSGGGRGEAGEAERGDGGVPQGRGDLRGCPGAEPLSVFFHGDVTDIGHRP